MLKGTWLVAAAFAVAVGVPMTASAANGWSGNITLASRYVTRGFDSTWHSPALQGGLTYTYNNWSAGAWASTVSSKYIEGGSCECDVFAGYGSTYKWLRYGATIWYYSYPGAKQHFADTLYNYGEVELTAGAGPVDVQAWVTYTKNYFGYNSRSLGEGVGQNSRGSVYLVANANFPFAKTFNLGLHVGHQYVSNFRDWDWTDASVSVGTSWQGLDLLLTYARAWSDQKFYENFTTGIADSAGNVHVMNTIAGRFVFSVSKSF